MCDCSILTLMAASLAPPHGCRSNLHRWGIYRGGERVLGSGGGGRTGTRWVSAGSASSFRLLPACVAVRRQEGCCLPWLGVQLFLLAGAGGGGEGFVCGNKNKCLGCLPFSQASLVPIGLCGPALLWHWNKPSLSSDTECIDMDTWGGKS